MSAHLSFCKFSSKHGLETLDIFVVSNQSGDDVIARLIGGLQTDVAAEAAGVIA
jgi:hypothetical protein